jgi:hypothetical protein
MARVAHPKCMYDVQFLAIARRSPAPARAAQAFIEVLRATHRS